MSVLDMARRCMRCSVATRRDIDHFPGEPHYGRMRILLIRLRLLRP